MERTKPTMKEANIKNDFLKAISGHKPTEVFRVHADIGNNKVGITGWYTKAVIDDVVEDIKNKGVKILKIEKSTDPKHLKESTYQNNKQIAIYDGGEDGLTYIEKRGRGYYGYNDEFDFEADSKAELERKLKSWKYKLISGSIHESVINESPLVDALIQMLAYIGGPILIYFIGKIIQGLIHTAVDVRNIVAPPKYIEFLKGLEDNDTFNKQFMDAVKKKGGMGKLSGGSLFDISRMITKLPEFEKAFEEFCETEGIDKKDAKLLRSKIIGNASKAIANDAPKTLKMLQKKYPEAAKQIQEGGSGGHFSVAQLENLRKEYSALDKKAVTESRLREIARTLAGIPTAGLNQLSRAGVAVLSPLAEIVRTETKTV